MLNDPRQERFCQLCAEGKKRAEALRLAGYASQGDDKADKQRASTMANSSPCKERILEIRQKALRRSEVSAERVIQELALIGFANFADYMKGEQTRPIHTLSREQSAVIQEVTTTTRTLPDGTEITTQRLKLYDKRAALVDLGRHFGLFEPDQSVTVNNTINQVTVNAEDAIQRLVSAFDRIQTSDRAEEQRKLRSLPSLPASGRSIDAEPLVVVPGKTGTEGS